MSLTVQSIANDVSLDVRQALLAAGTDLTILTGFIDRIHKDALHSGVYSYLNINTTSITTTAGTTVYTLTPPTPLRRILGVFDATRNRILFPIERATSPVSQVEKQESNAGQMGSPGIEFAPPFISPISLQTSQPDYFRHVGATNLVLYPTVQQTLTLNISYEQQVVTLVNPTDILVVPEDGRDMIVAGVDMLANTYLKRAEEAQMWAQMYMMLKKGESLV